MGAGLTSPSDGVLCLMRTAVARLFSDPLRRRMMTSYSVCHTTVGQNIPLLWKQTLTSLSDGVLCLMRTALARFLLDATRCRMMTSCLSYNSWTKHTVAMGADFDLTVGRCIVSDENSGC